MACKNQRCSNPLPRRGGKQAASEQCQTSSCSTLQRSSGGSGKQEPGRADHRAARSVSCSEGALWKMVIFQERAGDAAFLGEPAHCAGSSAEERGALRVAGIPAVTAVQRNQGFVLFKVSQLPSPPPFPNNSTFRPYHHYFEYSS